MSVDPTTERAIIQNNEAERVRDWRWGRDSIFPFWDLEMKRSHFLEQRLRGAEQVILALRRMLIARDSTLPDENDGNAWAEIEAMSSG